MSEAPGPESGRTQTETPSAPGPQSPPPRPPLPPTPPDRGGRYAMWLALGGILSVLIPVQGIELIGIGLFVAAVVVGVKARRRARRVLAPVPGAMVGIVIGSLGLLFTIASLVVLAVVFNQYKGYMDCRSAANTNTDLRNCQNQYFPQLEHKLHLPAGTLERHRSVF